MRSNLAVAALCILTAFMECAVIEGTVPYLNEAETFSEFSLTDKISFDSEQAISGTGFYNTYQNISTGLTKLGSMSHGSGSYSYQSTTKMAAENFSSNVLPNGNIPRQIEGYISGQTIQYNESVDAAYSGVKFGFKGSTGTVPFNSKLGEFHLGEELWPRCNYGCQVHLCR